MPVNCAGSLDRKPDEASTGKLDRETDRETRLGTQSVGVPPLSAARFTPQQAEESFPAHFSTGFDRIPNRKYPPVPSRKPRLHPPPRHSRPGSPKQAEESFPAHFSTGFDRIPNRKYPPVPVPGKQRPSPPPVVRDQVHPQQAAESFPAHFSTGFDRIPNRKYPSVPVPTLAASPSTVRGQVHPTASRRILPPTFQPDSTGYLTGVPRSVPGK